MVAPGLTSTFTYDTATKGRGQLAMMETTPGNNRRSHTYDSLGRPVTSTIRIDGVDATFTSTYDADGRLNTVQYPSGFVARYDYTTNQRYLQHFVDHANNAGLWTATTRNAQGQYTEAALGNGISIKRNFNPQTGRINTIKAAVLDSVANFTYAFDTVGNLTSRIETTKRTSTPRKLIK